MKWYWYYGLIIFIVLYCIELYLDDMFFSCESFRGKLVIFIHHIITVYGVFGSLLFGYYFIHIIFTIIIITGFILYEDCILNIYTNLLCNFEKDTPIKNYLYYVSKTLDVNKINVLFIFKIVIITYDAYMISKGYS